jgi:hypothetical protein
LDGFPTPKGASLKKLNTEKQQIQHALSENSRYNKEVRLLANAVRNEILVAYPG